MSGIKQKLFKVVVHILKLETKSNGVNCLAQASAKIQQTIIQFRQTPQVLRNQTTFSIPIQFEYVKMLFQNGMYKDKNMEIIIDLVTHGDKIKIGSTTVNLAKILNTRTFSIPTIYPLHKCYDKNANVKLTVHFQQILPNSQLLSQFSHKIKSEPTENLNKIPLILAETSEYKQSKFQDIGNDLGKSRFKSKIFEEQNSLLYNKIDQYQMKIQKYRTDNQSLQQNYIIEINNKQQKLMETEALLKIKLSQLSQLQKEYQSVKEINKKIQTQNEDFKENIKKMEKILQQIERQNTLIKRQVEALKLQVQTHQKNKESKDKHYKTQLQKYSNRFVESQHKKNLIILEMQTRIKQQKDKIEQVHRQFIKEQDHKINQNNKNHREKILLFQAQIEQYLNSNQKLKIENDKIVKNNQELKLNIQARQQEIQNLKHDIMRITMQYEQKNQQLKHINHSICEQEGEVMKFRSQLFNKKQLLEEGQMQLNVAKSTINEQVRLINKQRTEIQSLKERQNHLIQLHQGQIYLQNQNAQYLMENNYSTHNEIMSLKKRLKMEEEKYEQEKQKTALQEHFVLTLQAELDKKRHQQTHIDQQSLLIETQNQQLKAQIISLKELMSSLKEQNQNISRYLAYKNTVPVHDPTPQFQIKIQALEKDIRSVIHKHQMEKQQIKMAHCDQIDKLKNDIDNFQERLKLKDIQITQISQKNKEILFNFKQIQSQFEESKQKLLLKTQQEIKKAKLVEQLREQIEKIQKKSDKLTLQLDNCLKKCEDLQKNISIAKIKQKEYKKNTSKFLINMMDKLVNNKLSHYQYEGIMKQDIDMQVINYINMALGKLHQSKKQLQSKINHLQNQNSILHLQKKNNQKRKIQIIQPPFKYVDNSLSITNNQLITEVTIKYEEIMKVNVQLNKQIFQYKNKCLKLIDDLNVQKQNLQQNQKSLISLKQQNQELSENSFKIQFQLKQSRDQIIRNQQQVHKLKNKIKLLEEKDLRKQKQSANNIENKNLSIDNQNTLRSLYQYQNKSQQLANRLEQYKEMLKKQQQNHKYFTKQVQQLNQRCKDKDMKITTYEENIKQLNNKIHQLDTKLLLKSQHIPNYNQQKNEQILRQFQNLSREGNQKDKDIQRLRQRQEQLIGQIKENNQNYRKKLQEKENIIKNLNMELSNKQLEFNKIKTNLQQQLTRQKNKIHNLTIQSAKLKEQMIQLTKQCDQSKNQALLTKQNYDRLRERSQMDYGALERMMKQLNECVIKKQEEKQQLKFMLESRIMSLQKSSQNQSKRKTTFNSQLRFK